MTLGADVEIVASNTDEKTPLPANGRIELGFNRLLNPYTLTRQSILLRDKAGLPPNGNAVVAYDPVQRLVTLSAPPPSERGRPMDPWLTPGIFYEVTLAVEGDAQPFELRGIDGARVTKTGRSSITFQTTAPGPEPVPPPAMDYCRDVQSVLQAQCAFGGCHTEPPPLGAPGNQGPKQALVLSNGDWVKQTAIGRVAQEANTGPRAGLPSPPGEIFGMDMPIIEPGNPGHSWLLYKMMLGAGVATDTCFGIAPAAVPASPSGRPLDEAEKNALAQLVLGEPMGAAGTQQLLRVSAWIAQGAPVAQCVNACPVRPADAGVEGGTDAAMDAPMDAPMDGPADAGAE